MPALPPAEYLTPARAGRKIIPKTFEGYDYNNIVDIRAVRNSKGYIVPSSSSTEFRNSFFPRTVIDWNHLEEDLVCAQTVVSFKSALPA